MEVTFNAFIMTVWAYRSNFNQLCTKLRKVIFI